MAYISFAPSLLAYYLNNRFETNGKWDGKDEEIIISLILLKTYKNHKPLNFELCFPYKDKYHLELKDKVFAEFEELEVFFNKWIDNQTDVDSLIKQSGVNNPLDPFYIPIQIKNIGRGNRQEVSTRDLINILNDLKKQYPRKKATKYTLALLRGSVRGIKLSELITWLNKNKKEFPFYEVVLLNKHPNHDMEIFQLLPNKGFPGRKFFTKQQIKNICN
jgi:hypothetical protein